MKLNGKWRMAVLVPLIVIWATNPIDAPAAESPGNDINRYVWDLSALYDDREAWQAERATVQGKLKTITRFKGTLGRDPQSLADALDEIADLRTRANKMSIYGLLVGDIDIHSQTAQTQYDVGTALESQVESAVAFAADEIRSIDPERLARWLRTEPRLARHRRRVNRILREAPYTLGPEAQAVVESMARWPLLSADAFWALHDADLGWPTIKDEEGKDVVVDLAAYRRLRRSENRDLRNRAVQAFLGRLRSLENVFGLLYTRRIEADLTIARHRHFDEGMEAIWFLRDGMPRGSHRLMAEAARANLPTLQRYAELRRRALGRDRMTYPDLLARPPGLDRQFPIDEAMEMAVAASAPLGQDYQRRLRDRLAKPWMHLPPRPEKRGTYGIYPPVGGVPPYFLMSYKGAYDDARRLTGAVTLMMSFADIPPDRVPETRDDPGIYSNAIIYVGDMLHDDYFKQHATNDRDRIACLVYALDLLWYHHFNWVLASELDAQVEERIMNGDTPTGAQISAMYLGLLRDYYGHDNGIVRVDDVFAAEWMIHSVPFLSYEHQFWPPAVAAAAVLVERLEAGDPGARRGVHQVLGRGDLDLTYQLFQPVGIDMASPEPYQAVTRRMNHLMDELEGLLGSK